jgi:SAM-dependent methyltransferase
MKRKSEIVDAGSSGPGGPCRFCGSGLGHTFIDLGMSPLCESFLEAGELGRMEAFYPLHAYVCDLCFLVQLEEYVSPKEIFTEYAYFSSYSDAWLAHARDFTQAICQRLSLDRQSLVVELASNDGYLLQNFVERNIPVLGIEPAANVASVAVAKGIETLVEFFGEELAQKLASQKIAADLIIGNNVLAQVPRLNSFVEGMRHILKPDGVITMEFPHLMRLVEGNQFDTIYHEHFSYFSFFTVEKIFASHGLTIFDVEELWTHGGSLRIYAQHENDGSRAVTKKVEELRSRECEAGYSGLEVYSSFEERVKDTKRKLLEFLIGAKRAGKVVVGYGAPGKANTLLNYCGIRSDFLDFTVDRNPYKHGKFLPGTHIPIYPPDKIEETKPDYVLILPWNLKQEISGQLAHTREWGAKFVVPIPEVSVF